VTKLRFVHQLDYIARSAARGLGASAITTGAAVITIAVALVPIGALWVVTANMEALLGEFGNDLHLTAFLEPDAEAAKARRLAERVASVEGVEAVEIVSREEALRRFRARLGNAALLDALNENPLPVSLEIRLAEASRTREGFRIVREALDGVPGIESLVGGEAWVEGYARALSLVRSIAFGLGAVLGAAALLIVAITIRLTVYARRDELEILALVGASRGFLRTPFLVEGLVQGAVGGLLGLAFLGLGFAVWVPQLRGALALFLGWSDPHFLDSGQMLWLVAIGSGFGLTGAGAAVASTRLA